MSGNEDELGQTEQQPAGDPQLGALFRALTAEPAPAELAGEHAAMAMFRAQYRTSDLGTANHRPSPSPEPAATPEPAPDPEPAPKPPASSARPPQARTARSLRTADACCKGRSARSAARRLRLGLAAAAAAAVFGTIGAAYAAALPRPVQHLAYQLLGFAGVPDSPQSAQSGLAPQGQHSPRPTQRPSTAPTPVSGPPSSQPAHPHRTPPASKSSSPRPRTSTSATPAAPPAKLSLTAAQSQITAGTTAVLAGRVTRAGHPLAGATVRLLERRAGSARFVTVATATTGKDGSVVIKVSDLTTNAQFRLADPDGGSSAQVPVTVVPEVTLRAIATAGGRKDAFVVSAPAAQRGDLVVLQAEIDGGWVTLREHRLNAHGKTAFLVRARRVTGRMLRAELPATARHASGVSAPVAAP